MANRIPVVFENGVLRQLREEDNICDKDATSIAIRAESIGRKIDEIKWRDEYVAGEWQPSSQTMPDRVNVTINSIQFSVLSFDGNNSVEGMSNSFEINHDIAIEALNNEDIQLEFHIHYLPSSNNSGDVKWTFNYIYLPYNSISSSSSSLDLIQSIPANSQYKHKISQVYLSKPSSGYDVGDIILFNITRDPTDTEDTYNDDILLLKCALHVPVDSTGSTTIFNK